MVWRKASQENPLTIGEKTFTPEKEISVAHEQISTSESKWNLLIKNVQPHHAGVYECAISSIGTYTHYVALNVLSKYTATFLKHCCLSTCMVYKFNKTYLMYLKSYTAVIFFISYKHNIIMLN